MARFKGIDIPNNKRVEIALTYIHGIGRKLSRNILTKLNINLDTKANDLTDEEITGSFTSDIFKKHDTKRRNIK